MGNTILVTGSTGHVGSQVVKQLSSFKGKVRAAVQSKNRAQEIKNTGASLYQYSDLSVKNIAQQVDMSPNEVQSITDELAKSEGLQSLVEQSTTKLDKIMSSSVVSIDISKTVGDAAALMTEKKVGSVTAWTNIGIGRAV